MKKLMNLLLLVALLAMPVVLTSCGDEEDEPKGNVDVSLLMGDTWTFQKAIVTVMGQKIEMSYNEILSYMSEEMGTSNLIVVDQKLKFTEDEMILVNGIVETARRKKLHDGDVVEIKEMGSWQVVFKGE